MNKHYQKAFFLFIVLAFFNLHSASSVQAADTGNLADLVSANTCSLLEISTPQRVSANLEISSSVQVRILNGGSINIDTDTTLTINGAFEAPIQRVFGGLGQVVFSKGITQAAYMEWWGAKGDGATDDSTAFEKALRSGAGLKLAAKTYYIPDSARIQGKAVHVEGVGPASVLKSRYQRLPSIPGGNSKTSWEILEVVSAPSVTVKNLTLNGGATEGWNIGSGSYQDQMALLEIYDSRQIELDGLITTRFDGSFPISAENVNPDKVKQYNTGPVYIHNSENIRIVKSKLLAPSWLEGWRITNSKKIHISEFYSDAGGNTEDDAYTVNTPLNIDGPTTSDIIIENSTIKNHKGSAMNIGGMGNILIRNNYIDGISSKYLPFGPGKMAYRGEGIDIGIEMTTKYYGSGHPDTVNVEVTGNTIVNTAFHSIAVGGHSEGRKNYRNVRVTGNTIRNGWTGVLVYGAENVLVENNTMSDLLNRHGGQSGNYANLGYAVGLSWVDNAILRNNRIDTTQENIPLVDGGSESRRTRNGFGIFNSKGISISGNTIGETSSDNILIVTDSDNTYDKIKISGNNITQGAAWAIRAGSGSAKPRSLIVAQNTVNGTVLGGSAPIFAHSLVSITQLAPALAVSRGEYDNDSQVAVSWSGVQSPTATDWVGLYEAGQSEYTDWKYTNSCSQTPGSSASSSGSCSFTVSGGRIYEFRLFPENKYDVMAVSESIFPRIAQAAWSGIFGSLATQTGIVNITASLCSTPSNQPPTVSIAEPVNNFSKQAPAKITIKASASDPDGTISKVEFYSGSTKLGEDDVAPYQFDWDLVPVGTYAVSARAYDNKGMSGISDIVTVKIIGVPVNQPPNVAITEPPYNAFYPAPSNIIIKAVASDPEGPISKVEFYSGSAKLGEDFTAPYQYHWLNVPAGSHLLAAKAYDNSGGSAVSIPVAATVFDFANNLPPTVSITEPLGGSQYIAPASLNIKTSASDPDGVVAKVEFYDGTTKLGEDSYFPYEYFWKDVPAGVHNISAKVFDNKGAANSSDRVSVAIVNKTLPDEIPIVTPPVPASAYNFGAVTLRKGSRGETVKELQRFLNHTLGFGLLVDGRLGPKTILIVKKWQRDNGLVPDGLVGAKTKARMNASLR